MRAAWFQCSRTVKIFFENHENFVDKCFLMCYD